MSKTYTPGPYKLYRGGDGVAIAVVTGQQQPKDRLIVARVNRPVVSWDDETINANANLLAAAPEMLKALYIIEQKLAETTRDYRSDHEIGRIIRAAIAKAEGKESKS